MDGFMKHTKEQDNNRSEVRRLRDQHDSIVSAMGGRTKLILPPIDLTKPGLRILDSGCADGAWLFDVRSTTSAQHSYFGTDIDAGLYPNPCPADVHFWNQSIKEDFAPDLDGTFDFVHQRLVMAAAPPQSIPSVVERLAKLLKPGGWMQLIEADLDIDARNGPSLQTFLTYAQHMSAACGLTSNPSKTLSGAMKSAGLSDINRISTQLCHGVAQPEEGMTLKSMSGLCDAVPPLLMGVRAMLPNEYKEKDADTLQSRLRKELQDQGGYTRLEVVYGRKPYLD